MSIDQSGTGAGERRLTPADLQHVTFSRGAMLRPGYSDEEVNQTPPLMRPVALGAIRFIPCLKTLDAYCW